MGALQSLQNNREKIELGVAFVGIIVLSALLAPMLANAWQSAGISKSLFELRELAGLGLDAISVLALGLFLGLLVLMTLDPKKRIQALLLWFGLVVALPGLWSQGLFTPGRLNIVQNILYLIGGIVAGIVLGGGEELFEASSFNSVEFRRASKGIYVILVAVIVVAWFEFHFTYPTPFHVQDGSLVVGPFDSSVGIVTDGIIQNTLLAGAFVFAVNRFVQYDSERQFLVLGPKGSGKSLFMVGAFLEALDQYDEGNKNQTTMDPSSDLMSLVSKLDRDDEGWFLDATRTQELEELEFQYVHGSVFPKNMKLEGIDYAGEHLEDIPDVVTDAVEREAQPTTLLRVSDAVENADTLILLIDCDRFVNNDELETEPYFSILQATDSKDVILVATKADVLAEQFREERGLDAQMYYDDFKQYVNQQLTNNQNIKTLVAQAGGVDIHPVYYQTTKNERGERVPMRNGGSVTTVGFDRLLDILGEG